MRLPRNLFAATLMAIASTQCSAGTSAPRQINLGFVPNVGDSIYYAFMNPVKSIHKYWQRPSIVSSLQDKILTLEREIRASKEESRQLRVLLKQQQARKRAGKTMEVKESKEVERILRDQIKSLHARIEELNQLQGEMAALLKQEKEHAQKLKQVLENEREERTALDQKHREELDALYTKITKKSEDMMRQVEKDIVAKMTIEIERIKAESKESLALEKAKSTRLEKEKKEAGEAVEKEKVKMRKLVKVLAMREKQELAARSSSEDFSAPITKTNASGKMKTRKITSQRGSKP